MTKLAKENEMELVFDAVSENEGFARCAVAAFVTELNPTLEEIEDIKTAVSEAVTNSIIHGYENTFGKIRIRCRLSKGMLDVEIKDWGRGIEDVEKAMEPMFTTSKNLERAGMGFSFMEAFMDELNVESTLGEGTLVKMIKKMNVGSWLDPLE